MTARTQIENVQQLMRNNKSTLPGLKPLTCAPIAVGVHREHSQDLQTGCVFLYNKRTGISESDKSVTCV